MLFGLDRCVPVLGTKTLTLLNLDYLVCVCVCVCMRERERERVRYSDKEGGRQTHRPTCQAILGSDHNKIMIVGP